MKKELKLNLSPEQYEQLVEMLFVGSLVLEEFWGGENEDLLDLQNQVYSQSKTFNRSNLTFKAPVKEIPWTVSEEIEKRLIPYLFRDR